MCALATKSANGLVLYDFIICKKQLRQWIYEINKHNADMLGWTPNILKEGSFGFDNLAMSILYANHVIVPGETQNQELMAAKIHDGWAANYIFWRDNKPWETGPYIKPYNPLGDERRNICASMSYDALPEDEKIKDNVIAKYIIDALSF